MTRGATMVKSRPYSGRAARRFAVRSRSARVAFVPWQACEGAWGALGGARGVGSFGPPGEVPSVRSHSATGTCFRWGGRKERTNGR